jgi:hypothetical protein
MAEEQEFNATYRLEFPSGHVHTGITKRIDAQPQAFGSPLVLSLGTDIGAGRLECFTRSSMTFPADSSLTAFATRADLNFSFWKMFIRNGISYSLNLPGASRTFQGMPADFFVPRTDTCFLNSTQLGLVLKGYTLWTQFTKRLWGAAPALTYHDTSAEFSGQSVSFGLHTGEKQRLQFGSSSSFTNELPGLQHHFWLLYRRYAMEEKLKYEATAAADYTGKNMLFNLEVPAWQETGPFWDVSLKLAVQIRKFRLFYRINNIGDRPRTYFAPYDLPGLHFMWGVHWMLSN